jgi:hypothetical protein
LQQPGRADKLRPGEAQNSRGLATHLLPGDPHLNKVFRDATPDTGFILATLLIVTGTGTRILVMSYWPIHRFSPPDPGKTLCILILGFVSLTFGIEIVFSSFFVSVRC